VKGVLKSTWGVFKRILKNPITIALLIGGLFFLLWKWLGPKLSGGIDGIKKTLIPMIKSFASKALGFIQGVGSILFSVGKFLFKVIDWITNPKGWLAKFIVTTIKLFLAFKRGLKKLMKATGKSSVDILCMFLAGDMIGIAISAIGGAVKLMWDWLKKTKLMRIVMGLVNMAVSFAKVLANWYTLVPKMLWGAVKSIWKGNFNKVLPALAQPWIDLHSSIKVLFSG
jgi:hypothetical protein